MDAVRDRELLDRSPGDPAALLANERPLVDQVADDLLEEERVALGALEDAAAHAVGERLDVEQERDEPGALLAAQRLERDRAEAPAPAAPVGARAKQVGARGAQEEDRPVEALGELVEDVEHGRVGPVEVLDDGDDGGAPGGGGEQRSPRRDELAVEVARIERAERILRRPQPQGRRERGRGPRGLGGEIGIDARLHELRDLRRGLLCAIGVEHDCLGLEHLGQRRERGALAVRQAAPDQHGRLGLEQRDELAHEPALADARVADERDELRAAFPADAVEGRSQRGELMVAADERRREALHASRFRRARSASTSRPPPARERPLQLEGRFERDEARSASARRGRCARRSRSFPARPTAGGGRRR